MAYPDADPGTAFLSEHRILEVPAGGGGGGAADALSTTGADVDVAAAAPPTAGQVLRATDATHATWQSTTLQYHDTTHTPVGLWQFDGDLTDSSGNGYDLTDAGTPCYLSCDGLVGLSRWSELAHVDAAPLHITGDITVEMLIEISAYSSLGYPLLFINNGETEAANCLYGISISSWVPGYLAEYSSGTNITYSAARGMLAGRVHHLAMVRSSNQVTFYLDGVAIGTSSGLHVPTGGTTAYLCIGAISDGSSPFYGWIASVKIIASALTAAQVAAVSLHCLGA
jgi:hypothetical protein